MTNFDSSTVAMASNLLAMVSNLAALPSNLVAIASNHSDGLQPSNGLTY